MTWFGWPARGRRGLQADLSDLLEPPSDCADEAAYSTAGRAAVWRQRLRDARRRVLPGLLPR